MNSLSESIDTKKVAKGHLMSKTIYGLLTSPKQQTVKIFGAFLLFKANKSNSFVRFLGESTAARQSAFRFYLTFNGLNFRSI